MNPNKEEAVSDRKSITLGTGGLCLPLTVIFVALKLSGQVDWSWLWVLSPMWLPIALLFGFVFSVLAMVVIPMMLGLGVACAMAVYEGIKRR